ncbi:MAG: hypothetical protein WKF36_06240 [Candidatus Nitrosocosmicus sp.]
MGMGPYFIRMPDVISTIPKWQTVFNYAKDLFIHPDIDTDYIAIPIRV